MFIAESRALAKPNAHTAIHSQTQMLGAEIIVRALERHGVELVAGIPGGALLPLYEALSRCTRIRHILARHEQAAGFMAQGFARITRRAGVCLATSGPGVTNMLTALADAKLDSIPLVCIAGQVPTHLMGTDAFQEVATIDLARPITKAAFLARSANELDALIGEAFHIAESGRPGPVLIDVPKDVQLQRCAALNYKPRRETVRLPLHATEFDQAAEMVNDAERPVLYVGGGLLKAQAQDALKRLAERASIPVTTTLMAMGVLPHDHALNLGMLGMHGAMATHHALEQCDLLIAIGARFDDRATGDPKRFVPAAKIIHIDIDQREFGKIKDPTLAIHADAWAALNKLSSRVAATDRKIWLQRIDQLKARFPIREPRIAGDDSVSMPPFDLIRAVGNAVPSDAILTTDVGQHQMWVAQAYPFKRADRWLTSGGLGTMGFGLPAAMGAALAEPEATIVCMTGDGSLLMNIQELATLAELNLNVKVVVFDNGSLGMVRQQQSLFHARRYCGSEYAKPSDFVAIAKAFGIHAIDLAACADQIAALQTALQQLGPVLIRAPIAASHMVMPMVAPGSANVDAME
jgi:acetolactate synthase-1/2/3 large subunit